MSVANLRGQSILFGMALGSKLQGKYTKSNFMIGISSSPSSLWVKNGELNPIS